MKSICIASILLGMVLTLSACNLPALSSPNSSAMSTFAAQTVQAVLSPAVTQAALATSAAPPTATPLACADSAQYTAWTRDGVTYDAKETKNPLAPNKVFTMSWTLKNTGTCTWNSSYQFHFDTGTPLANNTNFPVIPVGSLIAPGATIDISIPMTAPEKVGEYQSAFLLQDEHGKSVINFGVITTVGTASSSSLASPGEVRYEYDCTSGTVNINLHWVDRASDEDGYRIYRDGNKLADLPADSTSYTDVAPYSGKYNYSVAAFNASGESRAGVKVSTPNCQ